MTRDLVERTRFTTVQTLAAAQLEWNAIDGVNSGSGIDSDDDDGDGDNTEFDRVFGYPYLDATYVDQTNPLCDITGGALTGAGAGLTYPIAGDVVDVLGGEAAVGALITGMAGMIYMLITK